MGVDLNGDVDSVAFDTEPGFVLDSGEDLTAWVDYNGTSGSLELRLNNSAARPLSPVLSYTVDLASVLGSPAAYIGFTSGTGGSFANHDVVSWEFHNTFSPSCGGARSAGYGCAGRHDLDAARLGRADARLGAPPVVVKSTDAPLRLCGWRGAQGGCRVGPMPDLAPRSSGAEEVVRDLLALTARLQDRAAEEPFGNPVLSVSPRDQSPDRHGRADREGDRGEVRHLRDEAFADRAERLSRYVGGTDAAANEAGLQSLAEQLYRPDPADSPIRWAEMARDRADPVRGCLHGAPHLLAAARSVGGARGRGLRPAGAVLRLAPAHTADPGRRICPGERRHL